MVLSNFYTAKFLAGCDVLGSTREITANHRVVLLIYPREFS